MSEGRGLARLYRTAPGRIVLKLLTAPALSRVVGAALSTGASRILIKGFIHKNQIDMSDYLVRPYKSFNDFFTRELLQSAREIDTDLHALVAPCDGRLSSYCISPDCRMEIKSQWYTVSALLGGDDALARQFEGGLALVFRLCVDDFHRYSFFDGGAPGKCEAIKGKLHTVRPIALENTPVFAQNAREYTLLNTDNFGVAAHIEVGAMLVGRIKNHPLPARHERGMEKGMFEFGGSTVVLLLQRGRAALRADLASATDCDLETRVKLGERIGSKT